MKISDRLSNLAGILIGVYFYFGLFHKLWDGIILGAFFLAFFIGLIFYYKEKKAELKKQNKRRKK